jgi:hypothetical protein
MKKIAFFVYASALFFLLSCQQDVNDIINQAQQCRIQTGYYYGGSGGMNDSANFIYDAAGKLIKLTNRDGYYLYTHNGSQISTRRFLDSFSNDVLFLDSVWYNSNNTISKMTSYDYSGWFMDSVAVTYLFSYQNNKLTDLTRVETYRDWTGSMVSDSFPARFDWDVAGNNIEKLVYYDNTGAYDSIQYQYDANPNYFSVVHPHFFLLDPMFQLHVGLEAHFPYVYSKNNVTNTNIYGSWDNPIDYGHDSTNKVTSVDMGGFEYMKYKYKCQ